MDQTKKMTTKKKKVFSSKISTNSGFISKFCDFPRILKWRPKKKKGLQFKNVRKFLWSSCDFPQILKWGPKKKRSPSPTFHEIRCESTKTTKKQFLLANSRTISTNLGVLGLDLHSSSLERVNFFGAQSSLGRARPWNASRGAGPHWWALEAGFKGPVLPLLNSS